MSPGPVRRGHQLPWFEAVLILGAVILVSVALFADQPELKRAALVGLALVPVFQLGSFLIRSVRSGRISGTTRAEQPAAFWSAAFGLALTMFLACAAIVLALLD